MWVFFNLYYQLKKKKLKKCYNLRIKKNSNFIYHYNYIHRYLELHGTFYKLYLHFQGNIEK